jgi:hypothetical protein
MKIENLKIVGRNATYVYDGLKYQMELTHNMMLAANDDHISPNIGKAKIGQVKSTIVMFHRIQSELLPTPEQVRIDAELKRQETALKKKNKSYSALSISLKRTAISLINYLKSIFFK